MRYGCRVMRGKRRSIRVLLAVAVGACTCVLAPAAAAAPAWEALGAGVDGPVYKIGRAHV